MEAIHKVIAGNAPLGKIMCFCISADTSFNTGAGVTNAGFTLGSINFYNYPARDSGIMGPVPFGNTTGTFNPASLTSIPAASNIIFLAGEHLSGNKSWVVEIPTGITLTVLRK